MKQEVIRGAITTLSRDIEKIGSQFPVEVLTQLVYSCGGRVAVPRGGVRIHKLPIKENYVIVLVKKRKLSLYFGKENEDHSIDVSFHVKTKIFESYGEPTLQRLAQLKHTFKSTDASTAMKMYKERIRQRKTIWQLKRGEFLSRKTTEREDIKPAIALKVKPLRPPKKVEITEEDLSFYEGSGINFRYLINSPRPPIRGWAQELHNYRKTTKDRDVYMSQLKNLHSKVSNYHDIKCKGKSPMSCVWNCDIWKLLHLCLYLMEEGSNIC